MTDEEDGGAYGYVRQDKQECLTAITSSEGRADKSDNAQTFIKFLLISSAERSRNRQKIDLPDKLVHEPVVLRYRNPMILHESLYIFFSCHFPDIASDAACHV